MEQLPPFHQAKRLSPAMALFVALFLLISVPLLSANEGALRVTVLPLTPANASLELKEQGELLTSFIEAQLSNFPGVEWVERHALDHLLEESKYQIDRGNPVALGSLAKADLLIHGRIEPLTLPKGSPATGRMITLEIVDLSNAEILASDTREWILSNTKKKAEPDPLLLQSLAEQCRTLLTSALKLKQATAKARTIAPVFFANMGTGVRLDGWAKQILSSLEGAAEGTPNLRLLRFSRTNEASSEQGLALLGLSDTDATAWLKVADAYIWGGYREITVQQATAFEEIPVEIELFLWRGEGAPQRFQRTFPVRDFAKELPALAQEIISAAAIPHPPPAAPEKAGAAVAGRIVANLEAAMGADFFLQPAKVINPNINDRRPAAWASRILRLPYGQERLAHCIKTFQLACFFAPQNPKWQVIRLLLPPPWSEERLPPNEIADMGQLASLLTQLPLASEPETTLFIAGVDRFISKVFQKKINGWRRPYPAGTPRTDSWFDFSLDAHLASERQRLLAQAPASLTEKLRELLASIDTPERLPLTSWLEATLASDIAPRDRLALLELFWPYTSSFSRDFLMSRPEFSNHLDRLMNEAGERAHVQTALSAPPYSKARSAREASRRARPELPNPQVPPIPLPPPARFKASPATNATTSLGRTLASPAPPFRPLGATFQFSMERSHNNRTVTFQLSGYGDELFIDFNLPHGYSDPALTPFRYRLSTGAITPLPGALPGSLACSSEGRLTMKQADKIGWEDLLSGETGLFDFESGLPVANPVTINPIGADALFVSGDVRGAFTAAIYNWATRQWITPPPPAEELLSTTAEPAIWWRTSAAPSSHNWTLSPHALLLYSPASNEWKTIDSKLSGASHKNPPKRPPEHGLSRGLAFEDDFWVWNNSVLRHFSPAENRILWQSFEEGLLDVAADGPYLWAILAPPFRHDRRAIARPGKGGVTLVLLERDSRNILGALETPHPIRAAHFHSSQAFFVAEEGKNEYFPKFGLYTVEKRALYDTLNAKPPPASPLPVTRPLPPQAALYKAILNRDAHEVKRLLSSGASANAGVGSEQVPPLYLATAHGQLAIAKTLIQHGATIDTPVAIPLDIDTPALRELSRLRIRPILLTHTALSAAAKLGDPAIVRLLLEAGADPNGTGSLHSPLAEAVRSDHTDIALELLSRGATLRPTSPAAAASLPDVQRLIEQQTFKGPDVEPHNIPLQTLKKRGATLAESLAALIGAPDIVQLIAKQETPDFAQRLLTSGYPIDPTSRKGLELLASTSTHSTHSTPDASTAADFETLHGLITAALEHEDEAKLVHLIQRLPKERIRDKSLPPLLAKLIAKEHVAAAKTLVEQGVDWSDPATFRKQSALAIALNRGNIALITALLDAGIDPSRSDQRFASTLTLAAAACDAPELLQRLLASYPDFLTRPCGYGTIGGSALNAALSARHYANALFLLEQGVSPDSLNTFGTPVFHNAFLNWQRSPRGAALLAGAGADLLAKDLSGRSIFDAPSFFESSRQHATGDHRPVMPSTRFKPENELEARGVERLQAFLALRPSYNELIDAINAGDPLALSSLLERHPPHYLQSFPETTPGPVYTAAAANSLEITRLLLTSGFSPNIGKKGTNRTFGRNSPLTPDTFPPPLAPPADSCESPLAAAARHGNEELVTLLLDFGAFVPATDEIARNAIDVAATPAIATLLKTRGQLQFHWATLERLAERASRGGLSKDEESELTLLLKNFPEVVSAKGPLDHTFLGGLTRDWLALKGASLFLTPFIKARIPIDAHDHNGLSPLHKAIVSDSPFTIAELVQLGYNPQFKDTRGLTPIDLAKTILNEEERKAILSILLNPTSR